MHPYDLMVVISIACVVGFIGVIYVEDDLKLALGYIAAAVIGCVGGGYLGLWVLPMQTQFAIITGAFAGGVTLALMVRAARRRWPDA